MKPILVTCVYVGRSDWLIGGKDNDEELYETSLKNLSKLDMPMHLYCWPWMVDLLTEILERVKFKQYKVIGLDLFEWPRSYELLETKKKFVWYRNEYEKKHFMFCPRNEILCHWKLKWCQNAKDNEWGCDRVVWIDAGVTEWCKIPESMGGCEYVYHVSGEIENRYPDSHFYPENKNNIFTPKITEGLKRVLEDKDWFNIVSLTANDRIQEFDWASNNHWMSRSLKKLYGWNNIGKQFPIDEERMKFYLEKDKIVGLDKDRWDNYPFWTLATIFGGKFETLDLIFDEYMQLYNMFTDNHDIIPVTEEPYYSIIAARHGYNLFYFDQWQHDKEDDPCFVGQTDKPFYTVFLDIINYEKH